MAYQSEVVRRARQRLEQARADRESEYQAHLQQAYVQVPRLREIDLKLRSTMARAAQAVFAQGGDAQAVMEGARQENLALQKERAALVAAHFAQGFLNEDPICDHCGGRGYVGSQMCSCLKELCRQEQTRELSFLSAGQECFDKFRLDVYPEQADARLGVSPRTVMEKTYHTCRQYAYNFSSRSENLLFSGGTGLGKTFLSACIARVVAENGSSVVYESAGHLFARLERAKFSDDPEARREAQRYPACDLLIVDDLGTEMPGQFVTAALYSLINDRLLEHKPTIISTNLNNEDLSKRYSPQIISRLRGSYKRVAFVGEDIRILRSRGALI